MVVPGHGYLPDEHEVVEYREVRAARPTADYDTRYGATSGPWTTDMFVEAVYRSLGH